MTACADAVQPADPALIPPARHVLEYLTSIYGKKTLTGVTRLDNAAAILRVCDREPAILSLDLSGWNTPTWGKTYTPVVERTVREAKQWWAKGGIVTMQFHWKHPMKPDGTAWVEAHGKNPPSGAFDMAAALTQGSPENVAFFTDLGRHADYLEELAKAGVPILWRPFHEIDGGWFWWTDRERPENTAALWRAMFDFLVKERGIHNLIWVYSAGLQCGQKRDVDAVAWRSRYYPGKAYVDIAGIDIYPNDWYGWGKPEEDTYLRAFETMSKVAPERMLALCEGDAVPNPDLMATKGPRWLYALSWWGPGENHTEAWIKTTYLHDDVVTRDALPHW